MDVEFTIIGRTQGSVKVVWIHRILPDSKNKLGVRLRKIINRQLMKKNFVSRDYLIKNGDFSNGSTEWTTDPVDWIMKPE